MIASRGEETGALAGPRVVGETDRQASIVKGIGMILVVCGHCNGAFDFFPFLPYSFHMPLFYFVSGYLLKDKHLAAPLRLIARRGRSLLVPYLKYYVALGILASVLFRIFGVNLGANAWYLPRVFVSEIFLRGLSVPLFIPGWFIGSLLVVNVFFVALYLAVRRLPAWRHVGLIACVALAMAAIAISMSPYAAKSQVATYLVARNVIGLAFFWAGFVAKESPRFLKTGASAALICAFVAQFYLYKAYGEAINIFMQTAQYSSVWLPFMTSAAGIFFVFTLAGILARSASASDWLVIVGDRSLHILAGHFAVFQLINIALMSANHVDIGLLSKLTWYTYRPDLYWPVYVIAGVGIPCVASQCWHRVTRPVSDLR